MKLLLALVLCLSLFGQAVHHVAYRVTGSETVQRFDVNPTVASVTITNENGGTEQHAIPVPWTKEFDVPSGKSLYLSAQKKTAARDGFGHPTKLEVGLYVDGREIQHAVTTEDYGLATVSGKVP
jgi:hypothetical protein